MIFFRPIGNTLTASSRLRVFAIQPHIPNSSVGIAEEWRRGDTLVIQKVPDIDTLKAAKSKGVRVIYDIDDYYWDKEEYRTMLHECDHITVDTEEKKRMLELIGSLRGKVTVIPDSLDWDGTRQKENPEIVIGWTGYGNNTQYLNPIIKDLPLPIRLVTTSDWPHYITGNGKGVQSRPWSLDMVDTYLSECALGLYYLPDSEFERCKGEHKLLKNWAIGIPTYTSYMPAYVHAMKEAGVGEKYLVTDWKNIEPTTLEESCREYALQFTAENVAKLWKSILL